VLVLVVRFTHKARYAYLLSATSNKIASGFRLPSWPWLPSRWLRFSTAVGAAVGAEVCAVVGAAGSGVLDGLLGGLVGQGVGLGVEGGGGGVAEGSEGEGAFCRGLWGRNSGLSDGKFLGPRLAQAPEAIYFCLKKR
jgi:hypothetical protein